MNQARWRVGATPTNGNKPGSKLDWWLNTLPDLLNTGFTVFEIGLFYGGKQLEAKTSRFLLLIAIFG